MAEKVILVGAGGHAKVIADIVRKKGDIVVGFLDDGKEIGSEFFGSKIVGRTSDMEKFYDYKQIIAIGNGAVREKLSCANVDFYTAIHPTAVIGEGVTIGKGTAVMAGAIINADTKIGNHAIINSGAVVEHDNIIEDFAHVSPGATVCGTVHIGKLSWIGGGACVKNNVNITGEVLVGVGACVVKDITEAGVYTGVPAKKIK